MPSTPTVCLCAGPCAVYRGGRGHRHAADRAVPGLNTGNVVKRMVDAWPWISVTGSLVIGGEALLLLLLLHRCKKREEED